MIFLKTTLYPVLILLFCATPGWGQEKHLSIRKVHGEQEFLFAKNETIRFRMKHEQVFYSARITGFKPDTLVFQYTQIPLRSIAEVDVRHKPRKFQRLAGYGKLLILTGVAYAARFALIPGIPLRFFTPAGVFIGSGFLFTQLPKKTVTIREGYVLKLVEYP